MTLHFRNFPETLNISSVLENCQNAKSFGKGIWVFLSKKLLLPGPAIANMEAPCLSLLLLSPMLTTMSSKEVMASSTCETERLEESYTIIFLQDMWAQETRCDAGWQTIWLSFWQKHWLWHPQKDQIIEASFVLSTLCYDLNVKI